MLAAVFARLSQSAQSVVARSSARRQPALQSNAERAAAAARPLAGTGLCGKAAFIGAVSADLLLTQLPQRYSAMMAEMEERDLTSSSAVLRRAASESSPSPTTPAERTAPETTSRAKKTPESGALKPAATPAAAPAATS